MNCRQIVNRIAVAVTVLSMSALPMFAARGTADFTRYVALGDSFAAGFTNVTLVDAHQYYSFPAIIARQAGAPDFQQPTVSQPGIPAESILVSLSPLTIAPKASSNGAPTNLTLPRPYNNLGVPGATIHDAITLKGTDAPTTTAKAYSTFILRGLGTQVQQALALHPTFITVELGGDDLLGAVLDGTPDELTPVDSFKADYLTMLDTLLAGAPNAGIVVSDVPVNIANIPFATTIPAVIVNPATNQPVLGPDGKPIFMFADLGHGTLGQLPPGSLVTLNASAYMRTGYGIPPALAPAFPTLPNAGKPLPDSVVLTPTEVAAIQQRAVELNQVINAAAVARNIPVLHSDAVQSSVSGAGANYGGVIISTKFLTGGFFGSDGFHPSDIGSTIIANAFIQVINANYGTDIPYASFLPLFANNYDETSANMVVDTNQPLYFSEASARNLMTAAWENVSRRRGVSR